MRPHVSTWAFSLRIREMNGIFLIRRHLLFLNALRQVFKWAASGFQTGDLRCDKGLVKRDERL